MLHFATALAINESPQTFTLDGQLFSASTSTPLLDSSAKIKVQIINSTGNCLLYEEQQTVNTTTTDGHFTIYVGSATGSTKRTVNDPGRSMAQVFQNIAAIVANDVPGQTCTGNTFTPSVGAVRYIRIVVTPSTTNIADTLSPDIVVDSVPNAMVAQSLQGLERSSVLQVNNSGSTVLTQANLEALFTTPAYANLQAILGGNFIKTDASGAALPSYASTPAGASNGDIWFDSTTNQIKYQTTGGVQTVGAAGGGTISSLTVGSSMSLNGSVAGTISSGSVTIDLTSTGVSTGTYSKVTVDTQGRVTAGTISLAEADIPTLTVAGKVSGSALTSGTISGSTAINSSGNLVTTGTVSGGTVQSTNLRVYNGSNYVQFAAPALTGIVNFTLPDNDGNPGDVLVSNGSGVLSWSTAGNVSGAGSANSIPKFTGAGTIGNSAIVDNGTVITASRAVVSTPIPIATGATVDLAASNSHSLASVGGSTITLTNMQDGGVYNIVIEDTTSRTYTFAGCTNSYYKPANSATTAATRTIYGVMTMKKGANWDCYFTWSTGFQ